MQTLSCRLPIRSTADRNEVVSLQALETMGENLRSDAQPYQAEALNSPDTAWSDFSAASRNLVIVSRPS
jgi:hypothetical protein